MGLASAGGVGAAARALAQPPAPPSLPGYPADSGSQRLPLHLLQEWEGWRYGMFICFGMNTFVGQELPSGRDPAAVYHPTDLDVDSWIQIARDAGMTYAVLTAKHVSGHCLWPSKATDYTVAQSGNRVDVVEAFVKACARHGIRPGIYYCSWDNHHRFGSVTPSDLPGGANAFTSSFYQTFQTHQVTELLQQYGPVSEFWVDIPNVLGRGYRTFLYRHIAELQPDCVIMMNGGLREDGVYPIANAWPADLLSYERKLPPPDGHRPWRIIEGQRYYLPGEVCDTLGKEWFYLPDDPPRPDAELVDLYTRCRERGTNLLLSVPPDRRGLIPDDSRKALERLQKQLQL